MIRNPSFGTNQLARNPARSAVKSVGRGTVLMFAVALAGCSNPADATSQLEVEILVPNAVATVKDGYVEVVVDMTVTNHETEAVFVSPACATKEIVAEDGKLLFHSPRPGLVCDLYEATPVAPGETGVFRSRIWAPVAEWGSSVEGKYRLRVLVAVQGSHVSGRVLSNLFAVAPE